MRSHLHLTAVLAMVAAASGDAGAADYLTSPSVRAAPANPFLSEFRVGGFAHDPWSPESGSVDVNAELLFAKPIVLNDPLWNSFVPRPHLGATINTQGDTSHVYAGLTWTFEVTQRIFFETSFGGSFNNGTAGPVTPVGRSAMGCHAAFRESASLGYRITENLSVMGTVEHVSNSGICSDNRGLTNVGMRVGYSF
ncbi:acyloxyacyl hydrolase [Alsobacter sp. SYSU BS001988]|jgi:lipid A 3-O-deacylase